MLDFLEQKYRQLPHGYPKIVLKNILGFFIHNFAFQFEKVKFGDTSFKVYKTRLYNNQELLENDIKGYTLHYKLKKGDVVIDAGAYSGLFTLYAAKKVGAKGKVIAFEPDPFNNLLLVKNIKSNNLKNVIIIKKGLYNKEGAMRFNIQGMGSNIVTDITVPTLNSILISSLDTELKKLKINKVEFIKMDIEGAEIEAMEGAVNTLKKNKNINLAIASYHIVKGKQTHFALMKFFKRIGMKAFRGYKLHPTTYASWKK